MCCGRLRVYDLPSEVLEQPSLDDSAAEGIDAAKAGDNLPAVLYVDEGETIYDYAWYPAMLAAEPASCVFASTARVRSSTRPSVGHTSWLSRQQT